MSTARRVGLAGIAIVLLAPVAASADAPPGSSLQERREYEARDLYQVAESQVERDRSCRLRPVSRQSTTAAPSAAMLNAFAPLRRPQRPEDLQGIASFPPGGLAMFTNYVRLVHAPDGTALTIVPTPNMNLYEARPKRCVAELRERFRDAISGRPAAFRRVARHELRVEIRLSWDPPTPRQGITLFYATGGTRLDLARLLRHGLYAWQGSVIGGTYVGLIPDGVATIDYVFRRFEPTGYWSRHHPVTHRATAPVRDNAVAVAVPLPMRDTWMAKQVWRAADGSVIRTVGG